MIQRVLAIAILCLVLWTPLYADECIDTSMSAVAEFNEHREALAVGLALGQLKNQPFRQDAVAVLEAVGLEQTTTALLGRWVPRVQVGLGGLGLLLALGCTGVALVRRRRATAFWLAIAVFCGAAALVLHGWVATWDRAVVRGSTDVRVRPVANANVIRRLEALTVVQIERRGRSYHLVEIDATQGWVAADRLIELDRSCGSDQVAANQS